MRRYLGFGALGGLIGGLALAITLLVLGEPRIATAIELESSGLEGVAAEPGHNDEAHGLETADGHASEELFSRPQQVAGGGMGALLYGVLAGSIFGVVFAAARHHLGAGPDWRRAGRLAALAFTSVTLVPALKYPANPPAVGDPSTVGQRTVAYLGLIGLAIIASVLAVRTRQHLIRRGWTDHRAVGASVGVWVVMIAIAIAALPPPPDPVAIDAQLVWQFRLASLVGLAAFWAVTAWAFGWLLERSPTPAGSAPSDLAALNH